MDALYRSYKNFFIERYWLHFIRRNSSNNLASSAKTTSQRLIAPLPFDNLFYC